MITKVQLRDQLTKAIKQLDKLDDNVEEVGLVVDYGGYMDPVNIVDLNLNIFGEPGYIHIDLEVKKLFN